MRTPSLETATLTEISYCMISQLDVEATCIILTYLSRIEFSHNLKSNTIIRLCPPNLLSKGTLQRQHGIEKCFMNLQAMLKLGRGAILMWKGIQESSLDFFNKSSNFAFRAQVQTAH